MLRLIIFAIIILWIVIRILKKVPSENFVGWTQPNPQKQPGKKYSWAWMQAAGALGLKFIRPEAANGYPAIEGKVNGIEVSVQCLPSVTPFDAPATMFSFLFPEPAKTGLNLLLSGDVERKVFSKGKPSRSLQDFFNDTDLTDYFLEVEKPELLKRYLSRESLDRLVEMRVIYPWILLDDAGLHVQASGIREDAVNFQRELTALLEVAGKLAEFAGQTAAAEPVGAEQTAEEKLPKPENKSPAPQPERKIAQVPAPAPVEVGSSEPADILKKSVFIQFLWSTGNAAVQKELFEKYRDSEVEWSGVLKSYYPYTSDFTFGSKPGVKAVFELEEIRPEGSFMPVKIKAVAAFPKDAAERFDHAYGKNFSFRGRLLKLEPIAREIYLADACLSENGEQI